MQQELIIYRLYSVCCLQSVIFCLESCVCCLWSANGPSTTVENPLQIDLFMQNKPNLVRRRRIANVFYTMAYENIRNWTLGQNKPNSNPIKPNSNPILSAVGGLQMSVSIYCTKDYRKNDCLAAQKTKPIQTQSKPKQTLSRNNFFIPGILRDSVLRRQLFFCFFVVCLLLRGIINAASK